jgi:hypothetical protein
MSKRQTLMALGICVIILPFLGFPGFWERILILAVGVIIVGVAYSMRPQTKPSVSSNIPYVEHKNSFVAPKVIPAEKPVSQEAPASEIPPDSAVHN